MRLEQPARGWAPWALSRGDRRATPTRVRGSTQSQLGAHQGREQKRSPLECTVTVAKLGTFRALVQPQLR